MIVMKSVSDSGEQGGGRRWTWKAGAVVPAGLTRRAVAGIAALSACFLLGTPGAAMAKASLTIGWRGNGQELKVLKAVGEAFTKKTGAEVHFTTIDTDAKLLTMFIAGVAPDLFSSVFASGMFDYAHRGLCEDLTPFIRRDRVDLSAFYAGSVKRLRIGSKQYGLPVSGTPFCTWYNANLFAQAGLTLPPTDWSSTQWTWDDMVRQAVKMTKDTNGDGRPEVYGFGGGFWPITTSAWLWGGDFFPDSIYDEGLAKKSTCTSKPAIAALQALQDLKIRHRAWVGGFDSGSFAMGNVGIYQDSLHSFTSVMTALGPKAKKEGLGVAVMPVGTAPARPVLFTDPWLISKGSRSKELAWQWIRFATLGDGAGIMANAYEIPPMTKAHVPEYLQRFAYIRNMGPVMEGALAVGEESPNHTIINYPEVIGTIEPAIQSVIQGKADPVEAMKAVAPKLDAVLARTYAKFYAK